MFNALWDIWHDFVRKDILYGDSFELTLGKVASVGKLDPLS
jgi:hypothetical protein